LAIKPQTVVQIKYNANANWATLKTRPFRPVTDLITSKHVADSELTRENECCVDNSHKVLNADDF